ncbi:hypothetical protein JMJ35_009758 [Cladonia borealis]|uniref:DUF4604 domain-containing protein n=1 Tax=Cladonia borealis TaxID=184061 RepID=A0AA39V1V8_9LECA|nr:hypothetical protein JMJ35_009758 [Cladonia borealis]
MTFNSKNLSYESNEPAFLRKLRSEYQGGDSARHERPLARPRKHIKDGDEDDEPTFVVEGSQDTLSKAEYEALMGVVSDEKHDGNEAVSDPQPESKDEKPGESSTEISDNSTPAKQVNASIGASNKRRFAKIVGDEDEGAAESRDENSPRTTKKPKAKKAKKVKLSFAEDATET